MTPPLHLDLDSAASRPTAGGVKVKVKVKAKGLHLDSAASAKAAVVGGRVARCCGVICAAAAKKSPASACEREQGVGVLDPPFGQGLGGWNVCGKLKTTSC